MRKRVGDDTGLADLRRGGVSGKTAVAVVLIFAALALVACSTSSAAPTTTTTTTSTGRGSTVNSITNAVLGAGVLHCVKGETLDFPPPGHVGQWKPTCGHLHGTTTTITIPVISVADPPAHAIRPACTGIFVARSEPCVDANGQVVTAS